MTFLNKNIVEKIIEENHFYDVKVTCPECDCIEDEQYTCTHCWAQGGRNPISMQTILQDLFTLKYSNKEHNLDPELIKTFSEFYQDYHSIDLHYNDYKSLIPEEEFDIPMGWKSVSLESILNFLNS